MNFNLFENNGLCLSACVIADHTNKLVRQIIFPPSIPESFQGRASIGNPSRPIPLAGSEITTTQQIEDQIRQLNQLNQGFNAFPQESSMGPQTRGQSTLTLHNGLGPPVEVDEGYLSKTAKNAFTGPNGLTKDVLSDVMFGNLKNSVSSGGIANIDSSMDERAIAPLLPGNMISGFSGSLAKSALALTPSENIDSDDPTEDLDILKEISNLQSKHNANAREKKKRRKSDAVSSLLLTLLVEKLKDMYEVGKSRVNSDIKSKQSKEFNLPKQPTGKDAREKQRQKASKSLDTKNIEEITERISNTTLKVKTKPEFYVGNSEQMTDKTNKEVKLFAKDSGTEFQVKLHPEIDVGQSAAASGVSDTHPSDMYADSRGSTDLSAGKFEVHTDKATISTLPTYTISSILNKEIPAEYRMNDLDVKENTLRGNKSSQEDLVNSPATKELSEPSATTEKVLSTGINENESLNYLEASRVLGAVFNKVKDPLARKSVEVAIKAMLKLMNSSSNFSKKQIVPLQNKSKILQEKTSRRLKTVRQLMQTNNKKVKDISLKKKTDRRVKHRPFLKRTSLKRSSAPSLP